MMKRPIDETQDDENAIQDRQLEQQEENQFYHGE